MKILIIPDIHQRYQQILPLIQAEENNYDLLLFLGDYFDNFNDTLDDVEQTALIIKEIVYNPKVKLLMGNHDLPYRFWSDCPRLRCSGNSIEKRETIRAILKEEDWKRMHLFHHEIDEFGREWYFTHAGISPSFLRPFVGINKDTFTKDCQKALDCCKIGIVYDLLQAGLARGGNGVVGGITWLDWNDEFVPIPFYNQIVGHTIVRTPQQKTIKNSENWNFDTNSRYLGTWDDGKVGIIQNKYLSA